VFFLPQRGVPVTGLLFEVESRFNFHYRIACRRRSGRPGAAFQERTDPMKAHQTIRALALASAAWSGVVALPTLAQDSAPQAASDD
jgi:hypothetical protein